MSDQTTLYVGILIIGLSGLVYAVSQFGPGLVRLMKSGAGKVAAPATVSSDEPAPPGASEYVARVVALTSGCPSDCRISYMMDGMTTVQILACEIERLKAKNETKPLADLI